MCKREPFSWRTRSIRAILLATRRRYGVAERRVKIAADCSTMGRLIGQLNNYAIVNQAPRALQRLRESRSRDFQPRPGFMRESTRAFLRADTTMCNVTGHAYCNVTGDARVTIPVLALCRPASTSARPSKRAHARDAGAYVGGGCLFSLSFLVISHIPYFFLYIFATR